jgi:alpha-N-acetylglucosaminidase
MRLLPRHASQFELAPLPAGHGREHFRISRASDHIRVEGSTPSALLFGVNWYLKYVAHAQISSDGDRTGSAAFPLPSSVIEGDTPYEYRYALNENVDGYTAPYWSWARWQREIDVLALSGINAVLIERGTDTVLYRTFRDVGYSDSEIRRWLAAPAHQNWQLMGNLCCFAGPLSRALLHKRAVSARKIIARAARLLRYRAGRLQTALSRGAGRAPGEVGGIHAAGLARSARADVRAAGRGVLPTSARALR